MLGGVDPVIIFQFSIPVLGDVLSKIPIISQYPTLIQMPPIPIYLNEGLTGIFIDSEDKNIDISTDIETLSNGDAPDVNQKGLGSSVSINMFAKKNSLGLTLLSSMLDQVFDKVTSKSYSITYVHGPITIFNGLLRSVSINQNAENELQTIKLELSKGDKQPTKPAAAPGVQVPGFVGALPLSGV